VLLAVTIDPEKRVKFVRGPARPFLERGGYAPVLIEVVIDAGTTEPLRMTSPNPASTSQGRPSRT
jgi:hypothetical protein